MGGELGKDRAVRAPERSGPVVAGGTLGRRILNGVGGAAVTLALLCVLEAGLRLIGYGYPTRFFLHHNAVGRSNVVENQWFAKRFMPPTLARRPEPMVVPVTKPPNTCRIFVFGESAAIGDPAPAFGFSRILEVLLRERYPSTRFEVINVAFTAINSHVLREIARDCRALGLSLIHI
ncbi:MAG: hypothetical protein N3G20_04265, partial [Verrucomicrobiae bacterium]|nr:hypothetical protein [Verrucomicrobiae bacterium]